LTCIDINFLNLDENGNLLIYFFTPQAVGVEALQEVFDARVRMHFGNPAEAYA
jgi:hypothetical protein